MVDGEGSKERKERMKYAVEEDEEEDARKKKRCERPERCVQKRERREETGRIATECWMLLELHKVLQNDRID